MAKRDFVVEILSKRSRLNPNTHRWDQVSQRIYYLREARTFIQEVVPEISEATRRLPDLDAINRKLDGYPEVSYELERYFPMSFVACIEGYFRIVYANLIDHGSPFLDNASKFDIRFGIDTAISLQQHSVSLGDFIAHLLPHNNLEDIERNMSTLIGDGFLSRVKNKRVHLPMQTSLFPEFELDSDAQLITNIKRLFELRHVFAHELSSLSPRSEVSIDGCIVAATKFLWMSELVVKELLGSPTESNPFDVDAVNV